MSGGLRPARYSLFLALKSRHRREIKMTCLGLVGAVLIVIGIAFTTNPINALATIAAIVLVWCLVRHYEKNQPR
jgi:hypothetical protein